MDLNATAIKLFIKKYQLTNKLVARKSFANVMANHIYKL